ncbi:MAG: sigma-54 dependent transcriptional regulator [Thermodesulfobacteriota bacterium]
MTNDLADASPVVLIVDDEPDFVRGLSRSIPQEIPCSILTAGCGASALELLDTTAVDLVLTDVRMPDMDGLDLLDRVKQRAPWITVIVMTGYGTIDIAVEAIKKGAYEFVQKPFTPDQINRIVKKALERNGLIKENIQLKDRLSRLDGTHTIVGGSPALAKVLAAIRTVAPLNVTVLMRGESGTGKDLAARRIHLLSPRADLAMVTVNCPAIPELLLESELFGYMKGAFTGADTNRKGLLEEARGSTLFLDEIGDISPLMQTKLLRVIQDKEFRPLGSSQSKIADVRVIASTNQDLEAKIADKSFRQDLYYRLNMVTIRMPALRDIRDDIPIMAAHFVRDAAKEFALPVKSIPPETMKFLLAQPWPGNVRQLRHAIQKAMIFSSGASLSVSDIAEVGTDSDAPLVDETCQTLPFKEAREQLLAGFTSRYLTQALERHHGNVTAAAKASGLERQHFQKLMRAHGILSGHFRESASD